MAKGITFVPDKGWRKFERSIDKTRAARLVNKHMALATRRNGLLAVKMIRAEIRKGDFAANAPLTIDIKGSSKPLVDKGDFFQSVTMQQQQGKRSVFAGVLQTDKLFNIARALHEGVSIKVTPKMRSMFLMLWQASIGTLDPGELTGAAAQLWERKPGDWYPLKASTVAIILPPRPFIDKAFANPELVRRARETWQKALASAFRELAKG